MELVCWICSVMTDETEIVWPDSIGDTIMCVSCREYLNGTEAV
jgi:hypothetical protein